MLCVFVQLQLSPVSDQSRQMKLSLSVFSVSDPPSDTMLNEFINHSGVRNNNVCFHSSDSDRHSSQRSSKSHEGFIYYSAAAALIQLQGGLSHHKTRQTSAFNSIYLWLFQTFRRFESNGCQNINMFKITQYYFCQLVLWIWFWFVCLTFLR